MEDGKSDDNFLTFARYIWRAAAPPSLTTVSGAWVGLKSEDIGKVHPGEGAFKEGSHVFQTRQNSLKASNNRPS